MQKRLTAEKMRGLLFDNGVIVDSLHSRKGEYIARRTYFYTFGSSAEQLSAKIAAVPGVTVTGCSDEWHRWPKQSYWEVRFTC